MRPYPRHWGRYKPPPGGGINYGHPLSQGLLLAVPFVEGSGYPRDYVSGKTLGVGVGAISIAPVAWQMTALGPAFKFTGAASALGAVTPYVFGANGQGTLVVWTIVGGYGELIGCNVGTNQDFTITNSSFYSQWEGYFGNSVGGNSQYDQVFGGALTVDTARVQMLAFTHRGAEAGFIYTNGVFVGGSTAQNDPAANGNWFIGWSYTGAIIQALVYKRPLTQAEIKWLALEPFAWMTPPEPKLFYMGHISGLKTWNGLARANIKTFDGARVTV